MTQRASYGVGLPAAPLLVVLYVAAVIGPALLSGYRSIVAFGVLNLVGLTTVGLLYTQAFTSLWCVYAALAKRVGPAAHVPPSAAPRPAPARCAPHTHPKAEEPILYERSVESVPYGEPESQQNARPPTGERPFWVAGDGQQRRGNCRADRHRVCEDPSMSGRDLVVLGTSSQVPTRTRNHNGYLVRWDQAGLLFDPGEGTQRQLTFAGVPASRIPASCSPTSTATTASACRASCSGSRWTGPASRCRSLPRQRARVRRAALQRQHRPAGADRAWPVDDEGAGFDAGPFTVAVLPLAHRVPTLGWRVAEPEHGTSTRRGSTPPASGTGRRHAAARRTVRSSVGGRWTSRR